MTRDGSSPARGGPVARLLVALVRGYQLVPRVGPPRCRFYPSCSSYAVDALRLHGALRGLVLIVWRIARCHPFHPGGVEYVPGDPARADDAVHAEHAACTDDAVHAEREQSAVDPHESATGRRESGADPVASGAGSGPRAGAQSAGGS